MGSRTSERFISSSMGPVASNSSSSARTAVSPLRQRLSGSFRRNSSVHEKGVSRASSPATRPTTPLNRTRRSSTLSEAAPSLRSTTDDILRPTSASPEDLHQHEPSHWHSLPLALALFPALGGLFFENGGAVITDFTLLALAAVLLNWSVRLPWDWYHAAQSVQIYDIEPSFEDTIQEEDAETENKPLAGSELPGQEQATGELRRHELFALSTCFIFPLAAAWLLHYLRNYLSRPSEGLVSNYNLAIFILAAELRPLAHLIKLVQARTLHLQRFVATHPHTINNERINAVALNSRIVALEKHVNLETTSITGSQSSQQQQEILEIAKQTIAPDIDALNRAVRRYEKRTALQTLHTDARLKELEQKLSDVLMLAAAAEHSSASKISLGPRFPQSLHSVSDFMIWLICLPLQLCWTLLMLPSNILSSTWSYLEMSLGHYLGREMRLVSFSKTSRARI